MARLDNALIQLVAVQLCMSADSGASDFPQDVHCCWVRPSSQRSRVTVIHCFACVCVCMHIQLNMERLCSLWITLTHNVGVLSVRNGVAHFLLL